MTLYYLNMGKMGRRTFDYQGCFYEVWNCTLIRMLLRCYTQLGEV